MKYLNCKQISAITSDSKNILVIAGAGSGKTRVLIKRIEWLIKIKFVNIFSILSITFTNKAAKEIINRISENILNKKYVANIWAGTFHYLCNKILRIHYKKAKLPKNFQIIDSYDQISIIKLIIKEHNINEKNISLKDIKNYINYQKENGKRSNKIKIKQKKEIITFKIYKIYEQKCIDYGICDFTELIFRCLDLLINYKYILNYYQNKFRYILIDEFQDTNNLQYKLLKILVNNKTKIFAVCDDDQSIYSFRGSDIKILNDFKEKYVFNNIFFLEQNYRSFKNILNSANSLIKNNIKRMQKKMWTLKNNGDLVKLIKFKDEKLEAKWIVEKIVSLIFLGYNIENIAILYRCNIQSVPIEKRLIYYGISYDIYGKIQFFEKKEIKMITSYLRIVYNINDNLSFINVVNFPKRGIGLNTIKDLKKLSMLYRICLSKTIKFTNQKNKLKLIKFINLIFKIKKQINILSLTNLIEFLLKNNGVLDKYIKERNKINNFYRLIDFSKNFLKKENKNMNNLNFDEKFISKKIYSLFRTKILENFISHISLFSIEQINSKEKKSIQLMTVHSSKGLEFDIIFIIGLEDGIFPYINGYLDNCNIEEERRLMYVAITRAKKKLYLSSVTQRNLYGKNKNSVKSRFLKEISKENLIWIK